LKIFSDKDKELELLDDKYTPPIPVQGSLGMEVLILGGNGSLIKRGFLNKDNQKQA